jgi:glutaredoxin
LKAPYVRWSFLHSREVVPSALVSRGVGPIWELPRDDRVLLGTTLRLRGREWCLREVLESKFVDGLMVLESGRVIFEHYGDGKVSLPLRIKRLATATSRLASRLRGGRGVEAAPSSEPEALLELYSYEASPYCRIVRETLSRLEIPYVLHNIARGSAKRDAFVAMTGKMQVPYLIDPSVGTRGIFETKAIVKHLEERYGRKSEGVASEAA